MNISNQFHPKAHLHPCIASIIEDMVDGLSNICRIDVWDITCDDNDKRVVARNGSTSYSANVIQSRRFCDRNNIEISFIYDGSNLAWGAMTSDDVFIMGVIGYIAGKRFTN